MSKSGTSYDIVGPDPALPIKEVWSSLTAQQRHSKAVQALLEVALTQVRTVAADYVENARRVELENRSLYQDAEHRAESAKRALERERSKWDEERAALKQEAAKLQQKAEPGKPSVTVGGEGVEYVFEARSSSRGVGYWTLEELQSMLTHLQVHGAEEHSRLAVSGDVVRATVKPQGLPPQVWDRPAPPTGADEEMGARDYHERATEKIARSMAESRTGGSRTVTALTGLTGLALGVFAGGVFF